MSGVHTLTGEHSRFRRWTFYAFAHYIKMPLLYWSYDLLWGCRRQLGQDRLVRTIPGWGITVPFGRRSSARPAAPSWSWERG